jgi:glutathione synthase/RimK-type ligase-like ATP-grasp enzyme
LLPEPRSNPQLWIDAIKKLVTEKNIDWIIPTCEEAFYLAWGAPQFKNICQLLISDFPLLQKLHHKFYFAELTRNWFVKTPPSYLITHESQIEETLSSHNEWVLKPAFSRFATHTLIKPTVGQLKKIQPTEKYPWVAQHFIAGKEHCSYSLIKEGKIISHACYHPKYRVGKGSGIYFEVTQPPEILEFVKTFAAYTHYQGQVAFDFIEDRSGKFYVLECNPRATSGIHLFNDQAKALTKIFESDFRVGSFEETILQPTAHPRMSSMAMMLFALHKQGWRKSFWQDFFSAEDIISHAGEHKPHYAQLLCLIEMCARSLTQRKGLLAAVTADIEWDGQAIQDNT